MSLHAPSRGFLHPAGVRSTPSVPGVLPLQGCRSRRAARTAPVCRAEQQPEGAAAPATATVTANDAEAAVAAGNGNGNGQPAAAPSEARGAAAFPPELLEADELPYSAPDDQARFWTGFKLAFALPWRRFKKDSVLTFTISPADCVTHHHNTSRGRQAIVAEPLTITGSIGVVTGKFNLAELYKRIGYNKELISFGRFAELLADNRTFSAEEEALFDASAQHAYASFRDKAAASRGLPVEEMQAVAQGRVWSGSAARKVKLVDALGGVSRAVALARHAAGLASDEAVRVVELGRAKPSPAALLGGGAVAGAMLLGILRGQSPAAALAAATGASALASTLAGGGAAAAAAGGAFEGAAAAAAAAPVLGAVAQQAAALAAVLQPGRAAYLMTDVDALSVGCSSSQAGGLMGAGALGASGGAGGRGEEGFLAEGPEAAMGPAEWVERLLGEW
ncbi:hypothetical protein GPECTOR_34g732 [Gonium pectorale]|uniref:Peptidase S49 domain-containing protein n=1 Tax=Gonium pectorale TaxID=33097 RepID=A0A150GCS6_GONPE|nr:hypothetical protein GPECTOR_34g732 [Gonium pectorale]|eukprot:KXZ47573.1 hypothetical protein GPECTOR_34g732 [Gonium pectorale]